MSSSAEAQPRAKYLAEVRLASVKQDLLQASQTGESNRVHKIFLQWKRDDSIRDPTPEDLESLLIEAGQVGHASVVSELLDHGAILDHRAPALVRKEGSQAIPLYQVFLNYGWDVNSRQGVLAPVLQYVTSLFQT